MALIPVMAGPSPAWELQLTGTMSWTYEYYYQMGSQGFFGPYNVDNGVGTTTANLNFWWNGARLAQNLVTGASANKSYFYVVLDPAIKINPAISLKGRYRLGQWNNPQASYYYTWDAPGTDNGFSEGQWTMFWATASLPWGTLGVGKRPWRFGTGLQYDGGDGLTTESLVLAAPMGPLDIGIAFYPHRPVRSTGGGPPETSAFVIDPYDLAVAQYFNHADASGAHSWDLMAFVVYNHGPLQAGVLGSYASYHIGPEGPFGPPAPIAQDSQYCHGTVFTKYNNGRYFFNAEAAWLYWTDRFSDPTLLQSPPNPRYTEQWRFMSETGIMWGPAKLTFLSAWSPGPDRRNGVLIGKQQAAFVWHPTFDTFLGNYDVFRPYSFLLSYNYGSGFNAYNLSLDGFMRDSYVLAARADYAVAANLNLFGTFMWAERTSNGYGWACIAPTDPLMPAQFVLAPNNGNLQFAINGAAGSPNIPDRALGWEIDTGFDWKLLEGFTTNFTLAYWVPGKWFNYACIDRSVPAWNVPAAANFFGTRPDKVINPILGGQVNMSFSF